MATPLSDETALEQRPDTALWSENFALVFADPQSHTAALFSIGTWYHDRSLWRENLAVRLPDGQIAVATHFGRNTRGRVVSGSLFKFEIVSPDKTVRISYDGPSWRHSFDQLMQTGVHCGKTSRLRFDLTFEASAPMWDMHAAHHGDPTGIAGAMHIEQLGQVSGTLHADGDETAIRNAFSCRDHSRGARDITNFRNHCWINGRFESGRGFQLYFFRMHGVEGPALSLATVVKDDRHHPATIEHIEVVDSPADFGRQHAVVLRSAIGEMRVSVREVLATLPIHMTSPFNPAFGTGQGSYGLLFDEAVRIDWNGETGVGWCERGFSKLPIR